MWTSAAGEILYFYYLFYCSIFPLEHMTSQRCRNWYAGKIDGRNQAAWTRSTIKLTFGRKWANNVELELLLSRFECKLNKFALMWITLFQERAANCAKCHDTANEIAVFCVQLDNNRDKLFSTENRGRLQSLWSFAIVHRICSLIYANSPVICSRGRVTTKGVKIWPPIPRVTSNNVATFFRIHFSC